MKNSNIKDAVNKADYTQRTKSKSMNIESKIN